MFDIPRLYTSACSYAVQPVRLYPILMSILLHHFKELTQCVKEVEQIEARLNSSKNKGGLLLLTREHEEEKEQPPPKPRPAEAAALPQERLQKQLKLSEF
jgi:hypothetical protein